MKNPITAILARLERKESLDLGAVKDTIAEEQRKPLSAAIFGQTGSGKSSLTNAIFGTNFAVDDVKPCTKEPQAHHDTDRAGNPITFWDLPGIGESEAADRDYLDMYGEYAASCDVVLWAFQADTRAMTLDRAALSSIAEGLDPEKRRRFLDRLTVVMTKSDVITPGPWIFAKSRRDAIIACSQEVESMLEEKAAYFYSGLLGPIQEEVVHRTYISSEERYLRRLPDVFQIDAKGAFLSHRGTLDHGTYCRWVEEHPEAADELTRLRDQCKAVYCSARYRFNLNGVKARIAQKSEGTSMLRLNQTLRGRDGAMPWSDLKELGLPVFFDQARNELIFSIEEG